MSVSYGRRRQAYHINEPSSSADLVEVSKEAETPRTAPIKGTDPAPSDLAACDLCGKGFMKRGIASHRKHCKGVQTT